MAKVTTVLLQGISYRWDGQDILVDDGVGIPWPLGGHVLEQVELFDGEGDPVTAFSIDFETQEWSLSGPGVLGEIILLDETGYVLSSFPEGVREDMLLQGHALLMLPTSEDMEAAVDELVLPELDDILNDVERPVVMLVATSADTTGLSSESIDDVINWLAVYSHHD
jgi:hypothetical protein